MVPDRIIDAVVKKASPQIKARIILLYIVPMVQDFLSSNSLVMADDSPASQEMVKQAIEDISYKMAEDVLFAHNKSKKEEIIKAWTKIKDHPKAQDMKSEVGSAFDEGDLDDGMRAAFEAVGEGGMMLNISHLQLFGSF